MPLGGTLGDVIYWVIFAVSLMVSISAGLEEFFKYGDRWRHYRALVEEMKIIGWQFFQLSGRFRDYDSHQVGFSTFVDTVEQIMQKEVEIFVSSVSKQQQKSDESGAGESETGAIIHATADQQRQQEEAALAG